MHPSDPTRTIAPTREDPVARATSEWMGGPLGRYAAIGRQGIRPALVVLSCAATVVMALSVLLRGHCLSQGWKAGDQFWHACYSDIPVVYQGSGLADGGFAYGHGSGVGQPAGTGLAMWLVSVLVPGDAGQSRTLHAAQVYFGAWAGLLTVLLVLLVALLVRAAPRTRWSVTHLALSPVVATTALVSFDLLAITLTVGGLVAWGRRRTVEAGILLGLAATCRTPAVLAVVAIGLVCLRAGRLVDWALTAGMALLTAVAVIGLVVAFSGRQALDVYTGWATSEAGYGSLAYVLTSLGVAAPTGLLTLLSVAGWVVTIVLAAFFTLGAARRPSIAEVLLLLLVGVGLTARSLPLQWSLWLVPLLALTGLRWREHLTWAGVEVAYFVGVWLHIAARTNPDRGLPAGWFAVLAVARLAAWAWLAWSVTRRARDEVPDREAATAGRPERDPLAGVAAGAPDRVLLKVV
ncbi:glycosyltransferase family 87 protein [Arsenicicoccus sp. oral taxon 190]|uniref:glycosyltransferase family 87 protein n=1 Tax=Arsenicicoccus sp. oral taxon 190 TaxID=1658671 RepID=UPI00067A211D|nr:DUF2029 domain-containing protein [Arsenicicoccus sp. oral taxon 190]AKT50880.1 hypothetical protein ADJ73_05400 [Arsenicicoccus sp. oral taxon 190]